MTDPDDLPPSALFVWFYLEHHEAEAVPRKQIQWDTRMNPRTVRRACNRLEDAGIVERAADWEDLKNPVYALRGQNVHSAEV